MMINHLMEIARIASLYIEGDDLEEVMEPNRRAYPNGDEIDFVEDRFNRLKISLLRAEQIAPSLGVLAVLWVKRPDDESKCEVMVAGRGLPPEGPGIVPIWPELLRAMNGTPTRRHHKSVETVYYPIRNSDDELVGALEMSAASETFFV